MKGEFNSFDPESCGHSHTAPLMHFSASGVISLNSSAVKLLNLQAGDCIKLLNSKRNPKEWYVLKFKDGFLLKKAYDKKCKSLMTNNSFTCKAIMTALNKDKGFNIKIGLQPDEDGWWSLITSGVK
jgi:hypothetical protein